GIDVGGAEIGAAARQPQRADPDLGQVAAAADGSAEDRRVVPAVDGAAAGVQGDRAVAGETRIELQRAAAEREAARGVAEIVVRAYRRDAAVDAGAAGIGVDA